MAVRFVPLTCAAGLMTPHTLDHNAAQGSWGSLPACAPEPQGGSQSHGARPSPNPGQAPPRTSPPIDCNVLPKLTATAAIKHVL